MEWKVQTGSQDITKEQSGRNKDQCVEVMADEGLFII